MIRANAKHFYKKLTSFSHEQQQKQARVFSSSSNLNTKRVIGIRREDQSIWESRAPLAPSQVRKLTFRDGYRVLVQPSNRRAFQIPVSWIKCIIK